MKKSIKVKLGTFSNDGLGDIFQINEEELKEMRQIISDDLRTTQNSFSKCINRLDVYLKNKIGAYPNEINFSEWFNDKKSITEWGNNLPKVSDDDIIESAKIYVEELNRKLSIKPQKTNTLKTFSWKKSDDLLQSLHSNLITKEFIAKETKFQDFKKIFKECSVSEIEHKIIWLKYAKNKHLNKKSISDLINVLTQKGLIKQIEKLPQVLSHCFQSKNGDEKFNHSNLSSKNNYSEFITDIETIILALKP